MNEQNRQIKRNLFTLKRISEIQDDLDLGFRCILRLGDGSQRAIAEVDKKASTNGYVVVKTVPDASDGIGSDGRPNARKFHVLSSIKVQVWEKVAKRPEPIIELHEDEEMPFRAATVVSRPALNDDTSKKEQVA